MYLLMSKLNHNLKKCKYTHHKQLQFGIVQMRIRILKTNFYYQRPYSEPSFFQSWRGLVSGLKKYRNTNRALIPDMWYWYFLPRRMPFVSNCRWLKWHHLRDRRIRARLLRRVQNHLPEKSIQIHYTLSMRHLMCHSKWNRLCPRGLWNSCLPKRLRQKYCFGTCRLNHHKPMQLYTVQMRILRLLSNLAVKQLMSMMNHNLKKCKYTLHKEQQSDIVQMRIRILISIFQ